MKTTTLQKISRLIIIVIILGSGLNSKARAQSLPPQIIADSLQAILNRSLPTGVQNPGAVVSVYVPGQWAWSGAAGHSISGLTGAYPATAASPNDKFRAGSITKNFMATAVLKLEEAGLLSLQDTIGKYLSSTLINDTINSSAPVTIYELLNHTSGIANSADNTACQQNALNNLTQVFSLEEAVFCGASQGEVFPPGFAWDYSNTNYSLLAMIIQKVSGQTSKDYITQHILTPLNLTDTEFPTTDQITSPHLGCYWNIGAWVDMTIVDPTLYWGWADIVSTTTDLNKFYSALRSGQVLSPASLTKMMTIAPSAFDYGLGTEFFQLGNTNYFGHSGEVGNSSGMFFADINSSLYPDGYYVSYNYNYQGVDLFNAIDLPVYNFMLSGITGISAVQQDVMKIKTYPNPAQDKISFEFVAGKESKTTLELIDSKGLLVKTISCILNKGNNKFELNVNELASGIYTYRVQTNLGVCTGRIEVIN